MMYRTGFGVVGAVSILAAGVIALRCDGSPAGSDEQETVVRSALTNHKVVLPIPVGFNPSEFTLAATNYIVLNDRARVQNNQGQPSDIAALGGVNQTTTIGHTAVARNIYSNPQVFLRGSNVNFVRTAGTITQQAGTTFGTPAENRTGTSVRQDPIWTADITQPDFTLTDHVQSGQTLTMEFGNQQRGHVYVHNGGRLLFAGSGAFQFTSLFLEPGAIVEIRPFMAVQIWVSLTLILRTPVVAPATSALTIGYFGTDTLQMESAFDGELVMAPNAMVEIKTSVRTSVFASSVVVHQDRVVTQRPLSDVTKALVTPTDTTGPGSAMGPSGPEISGAVVPPGFGTCTNPPIGLVSFQGDQVLRAPSFINGVQQTLPNPPPTPGMTCIGVAMTDVPIPPFPVVPGWPTPGVGFPSYGPLFTDSLLARLPNGRLMQVGLNGRMCVDPPQGPHCPATNPVGTACNSVTTTSPCYYGTNFVACQPSGSGRVWTGGAHNCPTLVPSNGSACTPGSLSVPCLYPLPPATTANDSFCTCGGSPSVWTCRPRQRPDGRTLGIRLSSNCGASWSDVAVIDPQAVSLTPDVAVTRGLDRQEIHVDTLANRVYLAVQTSPTFQNFNDPNSRAVVVSGDAAAPTAAQMVQSMIAAPRVRNEPLNEGSFQAMTTVREEQAALPSGGFATFTHFVRLQCRFNDDGQLKPMLEVDTPFGRLTRDLAGSNSNLFCGISPNPVGSKPIVNVIPGLSVVGIPGVVPRIRVAYTGPIAGGNQVINLFLVTLFSRNGYQNPEIINDVIIQNLAPGSNMLWPQLIGSDGMAGGNILFDTPMVLRFANIVGNAVTEAYRVIYPGVWPNSDRILASWNIGNTNECANPGNCFVGDYRYGAFFDKGITTFPGPLRYFTPWTGGGSAAPASIRAFSGSVIVTP